jgi:hypothetical protein
MYYIFKSLIVCRSTDKAAKIKDWVAKTNTISKAFYEKNIEWVCKYLAAVYLCTTLENGPFV